MVGGPVRGKQVTDVIQNGHSTYVPGNTVPLGENVLEGVDISALGFLNPTAGSIFDGPSVADSVTDSAEPGDRFQEMLTRIERDQLGFGQDIQDEYARRFARRVVDEFELAKARGPRVKRTVSEYAALPKPPSVVDQILAAEVNLLGGPSAAGKSLLARDLSLHVAAGEAWRGFQVPEARNVLYVASEGLHDVLERWSSQALWARARDNVYIMDEPINLMVESELRWLLDEYAEERPGLVVFDLIYAMGMAEDNGVKDVLPIVNTLKRLSAAWGCATLAVGHNGHNGERRFRGSSMWRQLAATEWHMADGSLTCEKSKIGPASRLTASYRVEYPNVRWLDGSTVVNDEAARVALIEADVRDYPNDGASARARRLGPLMGLQDRAARNRISAYLNGGE